MPAPKFGGADGQAGRPASASDSADEIHSGAYYLYLHRASIGSPRFEGYAQGNVQPLVDLRSSWYLKPPVQVVPLQIYVHVLGNPLLSIVDNDFVHCGVRAGAKADQGCLRLGPGAVVGCGSRNGKMDPGVLAPAPSIRTKGPVCLTAVMRGRYSTCIALPCTQDVNLLSGIRLTPLC